MSLELDRVFENRDFAGYLFDNTASLVLLVDREMRIQKINNACLAYFKLRESEVLQRPCGEVLGCAGAGAEGVPCNGAADGAGCLLQNQVNAAFTDKGVSKTGNVEGVFRIDEKSARKKFQFSVNVFSAQNNELAVIILDELSLSAATQKDQSDVVPRDNLTGLCNREAFLVYGLKYFQNARRSSLHLAVLLLDIDNFARINETYGEEAGDYVLATLARTLKKEIREADLLARVGGEEFALLMVVSSVSNAFAKAEALRESVENMEIIWKDTRIPVTISCGIATRVEPTLEAQLKHADAALVKAKNSGRNMVVAG